MVAVTICIDVPDVPKAVAFYTGALGCVFDRNPSPNSAVVIADGLPIYLLGRREGTRPVAGSSAERTFRRHWTPVHLDFLLDDVPGAVARVIEHGGTHEGGEQEGAGEIAYCADPFGNGFCVIRE